MRFQAGQAKPDHSGRQKGTPNKSTQDVRSKLAALGCDPIEGMARIAMDLEASLELRGRMFSDLAQYVYAKRKAVEHSGPDGEPIPHEHLHIIDISKLTPEELEAAEKLGASTARAKAGAGNQS